MNSSVLQGRMPNKRMEGDGDNAAYEFRSDSAAPHANRSVNNETTPICRADITRKRCRYASCGHLECISYYVFLFCEVGSFFTDNKGCSCLWRCRHHAYISIIFVFIYI